MAQGGVASFMSTSNEKPGESVPGDRKYGHVMKRHYQRSRCNPASVHFVTLELDYPQRRATVQLSNEKPRSALGRLRLGIGSATLRAGLRGSLHRTSQDYFCRALSVCALACVAKSMHRVRPNI